MRKFIICLTGILMISALGDFSTNVKASGNYADYDLIKGGTQQFTLIDEDLETVIVTIEDTVLLRAVENGTYKITSEKPGSYKASYHIVVSNNGITKAYNERTAAYSGSFTSKRLKIDSNKQTTYYLVKKTGLLSSKINLRATLKTNRIAITT